MVYRFENPPKANLYYCSAYYNFIKGNYEIHYACKKEINVW